MDMDGQGEKPRRQTLNRALLNTEIEMRTERQTARQTDRQTDSETEGVPDGLTNEAEDQRCAEAALTR